MAKQISLSSKKNKAKFAIVDDDDFAALSGYSWHMKNGYAFTGDRDLRMHRFILGDPPVGFIVDHINGDKLDNRRANLRLATHAQNMQNMAPRQGSTSRFKGVYWKSEHRYWVAGITVNKIRHHLGSFVSEFDAARAYNAAAVKYFGEYARLNIIPDDATEPVLYRQAVPVAHSRTSKYRGVVLRPECKRWKAQIGSAGKIINLGYFDTAEEAARAYDAAAKIHHGKRAFLNFLD